MLVYKKKKEQISEKNDTAINENKIENVEENVEEHNNETDKKQNNNLLNVPIDLITDKIISCAKNNANKITSSCEIFKINDNNKVELIISPLLSDIPIVMNIYNSIYKYTSNLQLNTTLLTHEQQQIIIILRQLEYQLLSFMMKQIYIISNSIKNDNDLKNSILKYSILISFRFSSLVYEELENKIIDYNSLQTDIIKLSKIKLNLLKKITTLSETIKAQNVELELLLTKITDTINK